MPYEGHSDSNPESNIPEAEPKKHARLNHPLERRLSGHLPVIIFIILLSLACTGVFWLLLTIE